MKRRNFLFLSGYKKFLKKHKYSVAVVLFIFVGSFAVYSQYMEQERLTVDPKSYGNLLNLIGSVESRNNYNAFYGNANNDTVQFTNMTIAEVMAWQQNHLAQGNPSSAVGRYQIISGTLNGLVKELSIDPSAKFDQSTQDRMAIALLERRGSERYVNGELTQEEFAANLAKEWAALPKVLGNNPTQSFYAGDGLNKSLVDIPSVLRAIQPVSPDDGN